MHKTRLDRYGSPIEKLKGEVGEKFKNVTTEANYCGDCYGAREGCCNSCEAVRLAYQEIGWSFSSPEKITQVIGFNLVCQGRLC